MADYSSNIPINSVSALFEFALNKYLDRTYKKVDLYHNQFVSTIQSKSRHHNTANKNGDRVEKKFPSI